MGEQDIRAGGTFSGSWVPGEPGWATLDTCLLRMLSKNPLGNPVGYLVREKWKISLIIKSQIQCFLKEKTTFYLERQNRNTRKTKNENQINNSEKI